LVLIGTKNKGVVEIQCLPNCQVTLYRARIHVETEGSWSERPKYCQPYCIFYNNKCKFNRPQQEAAFSLQIKRKKSKFQPRRLISSTDMTNQHSQKI
jgi:hypothetical protein